MLYIPRYKENKNDIIFKKPIKSTRYYYYKVNTNNQPTAFN